MMTLVCMDCGHPVKTIGRTEVCIACFVRRSTAAQGIPEKVEDPEMLADLARMVWA